MKINITFWSLEECMASGRKETWKINEDHCLPGSTWRIAARSESNEKTRGKILEQGRAAIKNSKTASGHYQPSAAGAGATTSLSRFIWNICGFKFGPAAISTEMKKSWKGLQMSNYQVWLFLCKKSSRLSRLGWCGRLLSALSECCRTQLRTSRWQVRRSR